MTPEQKYKKHLALWNKAREKTRDKNMEIINYYRSIPWWKFWIKKPSFEEQRSMLLDNWRAFNDLPYPQLADYFPLTWNFPKEVK